MRFSATTAAFVLGGLAAGVAAAALPSLGGISAGVAEVELEGHAPPADQPLRDWLQGRKHWLGQREAYLALPEQLFPVSMADLGIEIDVAETQARVERAAQTRSGLFGRLRRLFAAESTPPLRIDYVWRFDEARAERTLNGLSSLVHRDPIDARLDLVGHQRIEDRPGRELDVSGTLANLEQGPREDGSLFAISTHEKPAAVSSEMIHAIDVSRVLASYETDFENKAGPRRVNIAVAANYLNGTVLGPGEKLSFNRVVGERRFDRGFVDAPVIVEDVLEKGVGGGVCQVASTLHAAAVFAGLEIVQRRSHSRPSGYAPLGLDAVVIDGAVDLKIRNPYPKPVIIHAFLPSKFRIRVEFLGLEPPAKIEHTYAVKESYDFYRRVVTKPDFPSDKVKRHQKGIRGYDVVSVVRAKFPDGRATVKRYPSKYYPVPEVYWVGGEANLDELPELPKGATHVEIDGLVPGSI